MPYIFASPIQNLGVLSQFRDVPVSIVTDTPTNGYIRFDGVINLPSNQWIHITYQAVVDSGLTGVVVPINFNNFQYDALDEDSAAALGVPQSGMVTDLMKESSAFSILLTATQGSNIYTQAILPPAPPNSGQVFPDGSGTQTMFVFVWQQGNQDGSFYGLVVTDLGEEKMAQAALGGNVPLLKYAAVGDGDGQPVLPQKSQTGLYHEVWRGEIAGAQVVGNSIDLLTVLGASVGNFIGREIAFFDSDLTCIAVGSIPATEKIASTSGIDMKVKILSHLIVTDASAIQIAVNPVLNTVDQEQLEQELAALQVVFEGDIASHNQDAAAHPAIRQAITSAVSAATQALTPKQYGTTGGGNYCYYTLYPDGTVVGAGYTNGINSNGDNITVPSCGKNFTALQATASYDSGNENLLSVTVGVNGVGGVQPTIHLDDGGGNLNPRTARVTFTGRVSLT
jgi:hypothetical protein